jgi:hypothetical protein
MEQTYSNSLENVKLVLVLIPTIPLNTLYGDRILVILCSILLNIRYEKLMRDKLFIQFQHQFVLYS